MIQINDYLFINEKKIISASIWIDGDNVTVNIELDVNRMDMQQVYKCNFNSETEARNFILALN